MVLVSPIPSLMTGYSEGEDDRLDVKALKFADWFQVLLTQNPAAYVDVEAYLRAVIRDFGHLVRRPRAKAANNLVVVFKGSEAGAPLAIDFGRLSDGEKCFFLSAAVLGYAKHAGPVFCFWDEPDNHLSLPEVGHFILELRRIANQGGQFVATTHNPEAIRRFSAENTLVLTRNSHLEPTLIRPLSEISYNGDLINALIRDEVIG
jgi:predicted ATPase